MELSRRRVAQAWLDDDRVGTGAVGTLATVAGRIDAPDLLGSLNDDGIGGGCGAGAAVTIDEFLGARLAKFLAIHPPRSRPGSVQLAVALSTATRIEPELVRAVRLKVLPHLNVGAESDFWFSDWVGVRNPHVVTLRPGLVDQLRDELRQCDRKVIDHLHEVIEKVHADLSPTLVREEQANRHWVRGDPDAAQQALHAPLYSLLHEDRPNIADWFFEAVRWLPPEVLASPVGQHLQAVAKARRPSRIDVSEVLRERIHAEHQRTAGKARMANVPIALHGNELIIGAAPGEAQASIPLAVTTPMWVEILMPGETKGQWRSVRYDDKLRVPGIPAATRLRTAAGVEYDLSAMWLPSRLLAHVRDVTPLDDNSLGTLQSWRDQPVPLGIRLLLGWTHDERFRLADQFAADSEQAGWRILRAGQGLRYPTDDMPTAVAGPRVIIVVDRVESLYFRALPELVDEIRAGVDGAARVLLLADALGSWWDAMSHALDRAGIIDITSIQRLTSRLGTRQEQLSLFHRAVKEVARMVPETARGGVAPPAMVESEALSVADIQILAVAAALRSPTDQGFPADPAGLDLDQAYRIIARREYEQWVLRHAQGLIASSIETLAEAVLLTVLMSPLPIEVAMAVGRDVGVGSDDVDRRALWADVQSCYPSRPAGLLNLRWPNALADIFLGAVLVTREPHLGVDHEWAVHRVLGRLGELGVADETVTGVHHALGVLARAGHAYPNLISRWLLPFARKWPHVVVAAGGAVLTAVAEHADIDTLERLHKAIPPTGDRAVELDPADAYIAEKLIDSRLADTTQERHAELQLDLGFRLARVGRFASARAFTEQAVETYQRLAMTRPRDFLPRHAEAVLQLSDQLGELGELGPALDRAEQAEELARSHAKMMFTAEDGALGASLIVVGRQRARAGRVEQALRDAREAVQLLTPVANLNRTAYGPDLADALVSLSDRESEIGTHDRALATAYRAATLCNQLSKTNPWAHAARSAAALLVLGRRHTEISGVVDAVQYTERAVQRYQELARASPLRFEPLLAEAETYYALALLAADRSRDAHAMVVSAIARLRAEELAAPEAQLAWSLVQLGKILFSLGSAPDAVRPLREALDIYRLLPLRSKRDIDAMTEAQNLLSSSG